MAMRSSGRIGIAILLAGVALYAGSRYWMATRKLIALDVPISLSRGHIRTEEFDINLDSGYYVEIEVEKTPSLGNLDCLMWGCYETPAILRAQWTLSNAGQVELSGSSDATNGGSGNLGTVGRKVGYFRCSGGRYRLDLDVLSDTSVLNTGNPRLKVEADGEGYNYLGRLYDELPIVPGMLVVVGGTLLLLSRTEKNAEQSTAIEVSVAPGIEHQSADSLRRFPRRAVFSGLPAFAVIAVFVLMLVLIPLWLVTFWKEPSKGIWVLTSSRSLKTSGTDQLVEPLILRIDKQNRWFLDGKAVSPETFSAALKKELSRRSDWFVYLDANPELPFGVPAAAMDMIQELNAKIIFVTPSTERHCCTGTSNR
jgi:biopolymer transport protein ExbD